MSSAEHALIEVAATKLWHDDVLGEGSKVRAWSHDFASGKVRVRLDDGRRLEFDAEDRVRVVRSFPWLAILADWSEATYFDGAQA